MHEASLVRQVAEKVIETASFHELGTVTTVRLSVGPDSHLPDTSLRVLLTAAWVGTAAESASVTIAIDASLKETEARVLSVIGTD